MDEVLGPSLRGSGEPDIGTSWEGERMEDLINPEDIGLEEFPAKEAVRSHGCSEEVEEAEK